MNPESDDVNPQADNGVFRARMCKERSAELYTLQSVDSLRNVAKAGIAQFHDFPDSFRTAPLPVLLALVLAFSSIAAAVSEPVSFEAQGSIREEILHPKRHERFFDFVAEVNDQAWLIELNAVGGSEIDNNQQGTNIILRKLPDRQMICSDGREFYVVNKADFASAGQSPINELTARIGPGRVPFGPINDTLIVTWYAFALCYILINSMLLSSS